MSNFIARPSAAIGAMLAMAMIPLYLLLPKAHSEQFTAVLLAGVGAIYIGFGLQKGNRSPIATELSAAIGFFAASLGGLWVSPWIAPFAWAAHGICDYVHHHDSKLAPKSWKLVAIPMWYLPFCAAADWVVAASLTVIWSLRH